MSNIYTETISEQLSVNLNEQAQKKGRKRYEMRNLSEINKGDVSEDIDNEAWLKSMDTQVRILHYAGKPEVELSKERLDFYRRYLYYASKGPRRNYSVINKKQKLTQSDVLYILTVKISASHLAKFYNISPETIKDLRAGKIPTWRPEYLMVRRIRKGLTGRVKENLKHTHAVYIQDLNTGKVLGIFSSMKCAKRFLRYYLVEREKMSGEEIKRKFENKTIYLRYKIEEEHVITYDK